MSRFNSIINPLLFGFYSLSGLICAFFLSWITLSQVNFAYSWLHDVMDISAHSQKYGPQNRYRNGFEYTDKNERVRLFANINDAIHDQGMGLADIKYHTQSGKVIDSLLRHPEIVHLRDVSKLISVFYQVGLISTFIWLIMNLCLFIYKRPLPNVKTQGLSILGFTLISTVIILIIGPVEVFYALHEWIFPSNHKWFFYYQESLMTILMKAPDLFGAISILITLLALGIFAALNLASRRIEKQLSMQQRPFNKGKKKNKKK